MKRRGFFASLLAASTVAAMPQSPSTPPAPETREREQFDAVTVTIYGDPSGYEEFIVGMPQR